jgi:hypothetical protein
MIHSTLNLSRQSSPTLPVVLGALSDFSRDPIDCMQKLQSSHGNLVALRERQDDKQLTLRLQPRVQPPTVEPS